MELPDKTATQLAAENPAPGRSGVVEMVKEASCPSSDDKGTVGLMGRNLWEDQKKSNFQSYSSSDIHALYLKVMDTSSSYFLNKTPSL